MKIKLTKERKLVGIEADEFTVKLNGRSNADYKAIFAPLGIILEFEEEHPAEVAVPFPNPEKFKQGEIG